MGTKQFSIAPKSKDKLKKKGLGGQLKNKRKLKLDRKYPSSKILRYESTTRNKNWIQDVLHYINNENIDVNIKKSIMSDLKRNFFKYIKVNKKRNYISFLEDKYKPSKKVVYDNLCQVGKMVKGKATALDYEIVGSGNPNLYCINGNKILDNKFELIITIVGENHE